MKAMTLKAITLRNLPQQISRIIRQKAKEKGTSINKTVVSLLEEYTGVRHPQKTKPVHHDLDALAGSWTRDEASIFEKTLARQREIDPDLWK